MTKRILSISYDPSLLWTRRLLLEQMGFEVISAEGFTEAWEACAGKNFDLVILGHSVSPKDKEKLIGHIQTLADTPILAMLKLMNHECPVPLGGFPPIRRHSYTLFVQCSHPSKCAELKSDAPTPSMSDMEIYQQLTAGGQHSEKVAASVSTAADAG